MRALASILLALAGAPLGDELRLGSWHAWLDTPGGPLEFGLELAHGEHGYSAWLVNRDERIPVARVAFAEGELALTFDPYDSELRARPSDDGTRLEGEWKKRSGPERWTRLAFHAGQPEPRLGPAPAAPGTRELAPSRWALDFESSEDPAVLVVTSTEAGLRATILTTTGDYRYLAARDDVASDAHGPVALACFDGAHAFLLRAAWSEDGSLAGDFWSGDRWHETWTARLDPKAALPDPFGLTRASSAAKLAELCFPDTRGERTCLDGPGLAGKARLIVLLGSWCPNCNDEARLLAELDRRYRERGLAIVGLAFELTGDPERDARQVERFAERHALTFPLLVAGTSDKADASRALPLVDRVRAFPTTLFVRKDGSVRAVHQGYCGPATGAEHDKLREDFERLIAELLE